MEGSFGNDVTLLKPIGIKSFLGCFHRKVLRYFQMNQNWVQGLILEWLWLHFHLGIWMRRVSNPQLLDCQSSLLTTRPDFRPKCCDIKIEDNFLNIKVLHICIKLNKSDQCLQWVIFLSPFPFSCVFLYFPRVASLQKSKGEGEKPWKSYIYYNVASTVLM